MKNFIKPILGFQWLCLLCLCGTTATAFAQAPRPFPAGLPTCLEDDFRQLEMLYDSTHGDNWYNHTNWFTANMASWKGVNLTSDSCDVAKIDMWSNGLNGTIPNLNLPRLVSLDLSANGLRDNIPNFNLPSLGELYFSNNQLTGNIANFHWNVPNLWQFRVDNNRLTGDIAQLNLNLNFPSVSALTISGNQLTGNISNNITSRCFIMLNLSGNQLTGEIPQFDYCYRFQHLYLSGNKLTGRIPNLSYQPALILANFSNNKFLFRDIEGNNWLTNLTYGYYNTQNNIPIQYTNNKLSISVGGTVSQETFKWYKNNTLIATIAGDSTYTPTQIGTYHQVERKKIYVI